MDPGRAELSDVVIVGAGPTGASLAHLLARRGLRVVLVEQDGDFQRYFRGEGMMPSGTDALRQMGLGAAFARVPQHPADRQQFYVGRTLLIDVVESGLDAADTMRVVSQPHLLEMLVAETTRFPGFRLAMGFHVSDLVRNGDDRVGVRGRDASGERVLWGRLLVGADGRASVVRKRAGIAIDRSRENAPSNFDAMWCSMPLPAWLRDTMIFHAFAFRDSLGTLYPSATGQLRVGWLLPKPSSPVLRREDMLAALGARAPAHVAAHLAAHRADASPPQFFNVLFGRCPRWYAPRVLLLGDAAHPMNPTRAQGINLGLRDAIVAANHLVPALAATDSIEGLARATEAVQREREPEIVRSQELQLASLPPALLRSRVGERVLAPLLRTLGIAERRLLSADREFRAGVVDVRLAV